MGRARSMVFALIAACSTDPKAAAGPGAEIPVEPPPPDAPVPKQLLDEHGLADCRATLEQMARRSLAFVEDWQSLGDTDLMVALHDRLAGKREQRVKLTPLELQVLALVELDAAVNVESFATYLEWVEGDDLPHALTGARSLGNKPLAELLAGAVALFGPGGPPSGGDDRRAKIKAAGAPAKAKVDAIDAAYRKLGVRTWILQQARAAGAAKRLDLASGPPRPGIRAEGLAFGINNVRDAVGTTEAVWILHDDRCGDLTRVLRITYAGKLDVIDTRAKSAAIDHLSAGPAGVAWLDGAVVRIAPLAGGPTRAIAKISGADDMWSCGFRYAIHTPAGVALIDAKGARVNEPPCIQRAPPRTTLPSNLVFPRDPIRAIPFAVRPCALLREPGELGTWAMFCKKA